MSDSTIKQHYVPQRYLRHFANTNPKKQKKIFRFYAFDKTNTEIRPGNVEDYAQERYFYDVDFEAIESLILEQEPSFQIPPEIQELKNKVDPQQIEHLFSQNVETWLFDPITHIITTYTMTNPQKLYSIDALSNNDKLHLSFYLAMQSVRTKEFRQYMIEIYEKVPMSIYKKMAKTKKEKQLLNDVELKIRDEFINLYHAQQILDEESMTTISQSFYNKIWCIAVNRSPVRFYTSDNPIVKYGHLNAMGINSEGIEIVFPLTPQLALVLRDKKYFHLDTCFDNKFIELPESYIEFANSLQVNQSYRFVFSKENSFSLAQRMIEDNPNLMELARNRVTTF